MRKVLIMSILSKIPIVSKPHNRSPHQMLPSTKKLRSDYSAPLKGSCGVIG